MVSRREYLEAMAKIIGTANPDPKNWESGAAIACHKCGTSFTIEYSDLFLYIVLDEPRIYMLCPTCKAQHHVGMMVPEYVRNYLLKDNGVERVKE